MSIQARSYFYRILHFVDVSEELKPDTMDTMLASLNMFRTKSNETEVPIIFRGDNAPGVTMLALDIRVQQF